MTTRAAILNALTQAARLTSAQIAGACGLSVKAVRAELWRMREELLVESFDRIWWRLV